MGLTQISRHLTLRALSSYGAILCAVVSLGFAACQKKGDTPDWDASGKKQPFAAQTSAKSSAAHSKKSYPKPSSENPAPAAIESERGNLRFITYNVENWLTMDRYIDNKLVNKRPKPDTEKKAVINLLAANSPDVIGLCEIGEATDLAEIQESLKAAGLDLGDIPIPGLRIHRDHQVNAAPAPQVAGLGDTHLKPRGQALDIRGKDVPRRHRHAGAQDRLGEHAIRAGRAGAVDVGELHDEVVDGLAASRPCRHRIYLD